MTQQVTNLPVNQVRPGSRVANHRQHFDQNELRELAESIAANGLAQPITVRPIYTCTHCEYQTPFDTDLCCPKCGHDSWFTHYEVVAGERRYRAISQILRWETIPSLIRHLGDEEANSIMLVENTGRADLNPIEEANAYQDSMTRFGWGVEKCAQVAGKSKDLVERRIKLLSLTEELQHLVSNGHFPLGHAEACAPLDSNRQRIGVRIYRESKNGMPLVAFKGVVSQLLEEQSQDSLFDLENFWVQQVVEQANLPRSGKRAITGAPTTDKLPSPITKGLNTNQVIEHYIASLIQSGHENEAAAVGNLYQALVKGNYTTVSANSILLQ